MASDGPKPPTRPGLMLMMRPAPSVTMSCARSSEVVDSSRQIPLVSGDNIVGRDPAAGVWLDAPSVSRRHACIRVAGDRVTLEDLGSKNGTRAGDTPVTAAVPLADGDRLRFGSVGLSARFAAAPQTLTFRPLSTTYPRHLEATHMKPSKPA